MDARALIYLAIGIIYLYAQYKKGQKKREQQQGNSKSRPISPPTAEKDRDSFGNVYDDLKKQMDELRDKEATTIPVQEVNEPSRTIDRPLQSSASQNDDTNYRNIVESAQDQLDRRREEDRQKTAAPKRFAPPPRREYVPITPVKEELDENYTDTSMKDMIQYEQPRDLKAHVAAAAVNYEDDLTNPILNNFDLRNALIAQIILERPEF